MTLEDSSFVLYSVHYKDYQDFTHVANVSMSWTLQNGYDGDFAKKNIDAVYPVRAFLAGASYGFTFHIVTLRKTQGCSKEAVHGYRIVLHNPVTIPRPSQKFLRVSIDKSVMVAVRPDVTTTSSLVQKFSPRTRGCYFEFERPLKYFNNYTASNCQLECLTNYTLNMCRCVRYFMPREKGTPICGSSRDFSCAKVAEKIMHMMHTLGELDEDALGEFNVDKDTNCDCIPNCSDLKYVGEVSQADWDWKAWLDGRYPNLTSLKDEARVTSVTVFFESDIFMAKVRNELYGPVDFLANFGGLLGLFTGFSVLSLVEIVYFLTVRVVANRWLYGRWAGDEDGRL